MDEINLYITKLYIIACSISHATEFGSNPCLLALKWHAKMTKAMLTSVYTYIQRNTYKNKQYPMQFWQFEPT